MFNNNNDTNSNLIYIKGERYIKGEPGGPGPVGEKGEQGEVGPRGGNGMQGLPGFNGLKGDKGELGKHGLSIVGSTGPKGEIGPRGFLGNVGSIGPTGATGTTANIRDFFNEEGKNIINTLSDLDIKPVLFFDNNPQSKLNISCDLNFNLKKSILTIGDIQKNSIYYSKYSPNLINLYSLYNDSINVEINTPALLEKITYDIHNIENSSKNIIELISQTIIDNKSESIQTIPDINTGLNALPNKSIKGYFFTKKDDYIAYESGLVEQSSSSIHDGEIISDSYKLNSKKKSIGRACRSLNDDNTPELNITKNAGEFKYFKKSSIKSNFEINNNRFEFIKDRNNILNNTIRGSKRLLALSSLDISFSIANDAKYPFASGINNTTNYMNSFKRHMESIIKPGNVIRTALNVQLGFSNNLSSGWHREVDSNYQYSLPNKLRNKKYNKIYNINNNITDNNWSSEKYGSSFFIPPGDPGSYFRNDLHPGFYNNSINNNSCYGENQMPWGIITKLVDFITIPIDYNSNNTEIEGDRNNIKIPLQSDDTIDRSNNKIKEFTVAIIEIETLNHAREFEYWSPYLTSEGSFITSSFLYGLPQYDVKKYAETNNNLYDDFIYNYSNYLDIIDYRSLNNVINSDDTVNWKMLWKYLEDPSYDWDEINRNTNLILDTLELVAHPTIVKTNLVENFEKQQIIVNATLTQNQIYIDNLSLVKQNNNDTVINNNPSDIKYLSINDEFYNSDINIKIKSDKYIPNLLSLGKNISDNKKKFTIDSYSNITVCKNKNDITLQTDVENIKTNLSYNSSNNKYSMIVKPDMITVNSILEGNQSSKNIITASNLVPRESIYNLGNNDKMWDNIYVNKLHYNTLLLNNDTDISNETIINNLKLIGKISSNIILDSSYSIGIDNNPIEKIYINQANINSIDKNIKFNNNITLEQQVNISSVPLSNENYTYNNILIYNHKGGIGSIPSDLSYNDLITNYTTNYLTNQTNFGTKLQSERITTRSILSEIIGSNISIMKESVSKSSKSNIMYLEYKNDANNTKYLQFITNSSLKPVCNFSNKIKISSTNDIFIDLDENIGKQPLTSLTFEMNFINISLVSINAKVEYAENNINIQFNVSGIGSFENLGSHKVFCSFCNLNGKTTNKNTNISVDKVGLQFKHQYTQSEINKGVWINFTITAERLDSNIKSYSSIQGGEKLIDNTEIIL